MYSTIKASNYDNLFLTYTTPATKAAAIQTKPVPLAIPSNKNVGMIIEVVMQGWGG